MYNLEVEKKLKKFSLKIKNKKLTIGAWLQISSPEVASIISSGPFDWIGIDMEHGNIDLSQLSQILLAIENQRKISLVRTSNNDDNNISRYLDLGAKGLIIPNANTPEIIQKIVQKTRYKKGIRGVGYSRSNSYGLKLKDQMKFSDSIEIIPMIENLSAFDNLDKILDIKEINILFIGPKDLENSLKKEKSKFKLKDVIKIIRKKVISKKKICGIHQVEPEIKKLDNKIKEGYKFIAYSTDAQFIVKGFSNVEEKI